MYLPIELQSLVDIHDQPFVIIDRDQRVVVINKAFEDAYDIRRADAVGRACHTLIPRSDRPCPCGPDGAKCPFGDVFDGGGTTVASHRYLDAENREHQVQIQGYALTAGDGATHLGELIQQDAMRHHEAPIGRTPSAPRMVGSSRVFLETLARLKLAAASDAPVLLEGETGTGKELAAACIHRHSSRRNGPFHTLDCSTLTGDLFESEVFGHERGAFTGSTGSKTGLFELAHTGTLFLDEVGELPLPLQAKLLRALESGEYRRVGGTAMRHADLRLIAATNRELRGAPWFREDLYYRMACITVRLPSLRDRRTDIPALALEQLSRIGHSAGLDDDALRLLQGYDYPGNIRELRNVLWVAAINSAERPIAGAAIAAALPIGSLAAEPRTTCETEHHPEHPERNVVRFVGNLDWDTVGNPLLRVEADHLVKVLARHNGNRRAVAAELGISERTVYRKLRKHKLGGRT